MKKTIKSKTRIVLYLLLVFLFATNTISSYSLNAYAVEDEGAATEEPATIEELEPHVTDMESMQGTEPAQGKTEAPKNETESAETQEDEKSTESQKGEESEEGPKAEKKPADETQNEDSLTTTGSESKSLNITNSKGEKYRIEQVRVVMPYARAYFYPESSFSGKDDTLAILGTEKLECTDVKSFGESGQSVDYYFLIDNSKSVDSKEFEDTKAFILEAIGRMNSGDTVSIYVVGDGAEKKVSKLSPGDSAISEALDEIKREGMDTNLYNAIRNTAAEIFGDAEKKNYDATDDIEEGLELGKNRPVIVAVTDGVNDTANGYGKDETIAKLNDNNIPLYLIQQKMQGEKGNESRADIQQVVRQSGGMIYITSDYEDSNPLITLVKDVNDCYVATFKAAGNIASGETTDFNIEYTTDGETKTFEPKKVIVDKHMADASAPEVKEITVVDEHTFRIDYSEAVSDSALNVSLYEIINERNESIKPTGADFDVDSSNSSVLLTTSEKILNGSYEVKIAGGFTDVSQEKNAAEPFSKTVTFTAGEDYHEPEVVKESFFQKYWYLIMAIFVLAVIITLVIIYAAIKSRKGLVVVDDEVVLGDRVEQKTHVQLVKETEVVPGAPVRTPVRQGIMMILSIRSGGKVIKEIKKEIQGSLIIGRSNICDIYVDDPQMSKQHFAIESKGNEMFIMDLESKNGTYLNGVRIVGKRKLSKEDRIKAGNLDIVIRWQA